MLTFNVDISAPSGPLVVYTMQADSMSRFFALTITDSGAAWTPPTGAIWTVRFGAPQMPSGWYDTITEPGGSTHAAVVVDENTATVEIAEQAISTPGQNVLCVLVTDAQGYQIASWPFVLSIQAVPGLEAPEATVYYNALTEQVAQVLSNATAAAASATLAQSWAVGGTGTREGENTNNAQYWAEQAQSVAQGQLGWFETEQALQAAHPTGENGQWAIVGSTDTIWTWDSDTNAWVNSGNTTDLSNYYTIPQANAAFATAAQGAKADTAVQSVNGKTGTALTLNPQDVGGISTYTCTTSGSTHALTGTGNNIKFVADAAYSAGDTITVNGQAVTAQTQDGAELTAGAWASGATVVCWLNGTTLTVAGGVSNYSTTAVETGEKWIDGKAIYKKTFIGAMNPSGSPLLVPIGANVDTCVKIDGGVNVNGTYWPFCSSEKPTTANFAVVRVYTNAASDKNKLVILSNTITANYAYHVTVWYTEV